MLAIFKVMAMNESWLYPIINLYFEDIEIKIQYNLKHLDYSWKMLRWINIFVMVIWFNYGKIE